MTLLRRLALVLAVGIARLDAFALNLHLTPTPEAPALAAPFSLEIRVSGLVADAAPSLGVFDLLLIYDPVFIAFSSLTFGDPIAGNQLALLAPTSLTTTTQPFAGAIRLFEASVDDVATLNERQLPAFTLATLTFLPLVLGPTELTLQILSLGDADGDALSAEPQHLRMLITPEPSALQLLFLGLAILGFRAR